jgi:hypothetical protein
MNSSARTGVVAAIMLACGLAGFWVQALLPAQSLSDGKGMIGSIVGLVTLLLALVLGLLVWTSYGVYTNQFNESQSLGPILLQLDYLLERYGPDAREGRQLLHELVHRARELFWGAGGSDSLYAQSRDNLHRVTEFFAALAPQNEEQRAIVAAARPFYIQIIQTTLLMARQIANPVPITLEIVVVGWAALLFFCYGVLNTLNAVSGFALVLGSVAVSSAMFIILEFSQPYTGLLRISPVGIDTLIRALGASKPDDAGTAR